MSRLTPPPESDSGPAPNPARDAPFAGSDERFRALIEHSTDVIAILDADGIIRYQSGSVESVLGHDPNTMIGADPFTLIHPHDRATIQQFFDDIKQEPGRKVAAEFRFRHADGSWRWIESTVRNLFHVESIRGIVVNSRDITERKDIEERYRILIENIPAVTYIESVAETAGATTDEVFISPQIEAVTGYTPAEWVTDPDLGLRITHPEDRDRVEQQVIESDATEGSYETESRVTHRDGRTIWIRNHARLHRDEDGTPRFWQGFILDITAQRDAEAALRSAEERYRHLVEQNPAAIYTYAADGSGAVTYMSPQIERITGYPPEEWVRDPSFWMRIVHPNDVERTATEAERTDATGDPYLMEHRYICHDGRIVWVRNEAVLIRDNAGRPLWWQGFINDITDRKLAEEALQASEERFRALIHNAADLITLANANGYPIYDSPSVERVLGYTPNELATVDMFTLVHPDDVESCRAFYERVTSAPHSQPLETEFRFRHKDGTWRWLTSIGTNLLDHPAVSAVVVNSRDITDRKTAEERLAAAEEKYRSLVEHIPLATYTEVIGTGVTYMSPQAERVTGYPPEEWLGGMERWLAMTHPEDRERVRAELLRTDETGDPYRQEYRYLTPDGRTVWARNEATLVRDTDGMPLYWHGFILDITDRKALEGELRRQALHDALTGLPNRTLLIDRLKHALVESKRPGSYVGLLFLDLDNFKVVNDSLGHAMGDRLLSEVAERLLRCVRAGDTVCRLGGDEFALVLSDLSAIEDALEVVTRIQAAFSAPFELVGRFHTITPSIGVAISTGHEDADDLLRHADVAMYRAKGAGRNRFEVFGAAMHAAAMARLDLEHALRQAVEREEWVVHYQPSVSLATGQIVAIEALVRWHHPERGLVYPGEFIPLAEDTGVIVSLGLAVLRRAVSDAQQWNSLSWDNHPLDVSVNLSARQFRQPNLVDVVHEILASSELDPQRLRLEITETAVMDDPEETVARLHALKSLGVRIAIDDFGTGYSSLAYLKRFPVDVLKVDRSFVDGLGESEEDTAIVQAIIVLAHSLGIEVVAEGVETKAQADHLIRLDCDRAQGFYFFKPMDETRLRTLLSSRTDR